MIKEFERIFEDEYYKTCEVRGCACHDDFEKAIRKRVTIAVIELSDGNPKTINMLCKEAEERFVNTFWRD